jgi:hypothetical protein
MNYDEIKESIDATIQNLDASISTATGTVTNLIVSGCSVPISGCYGYAQRLSNRVFPDLCTFDDLKKHAIIKGIPFNDDISEDELRDKVLRAYRIPPSGADRQSWEMMLDGELVNVQCGYYCVFDNQDARGIGTVDIVLDYRIDPNVLGTVEFIVGKFRPLGLADIQVSSAEMVSVELKIKIRGNADRLAIQKEISDMYSKESNTIRPAAPIFQSRIESIAVKYGAEDAKMSWRYDDGNDNEWISGSLTDNYRVEAPRKIYRQFVIDKDVVFE